MSKIAIVTGASGNLGRAVIQKFLSEQYKVTGTIIANDPVPVNFQDENFEKKTVDLFDENDSRGFVDSVAEAHSFIDVAVLTAGGFAMGDIGSTNAADISKQFKLNFETAYNIARPVFQQMMKQGTGRIFLFGSKPGLHFAHAKGMVAYSLSKSLLFRLAELMNEEARGKNIVTSVVVPGTIDTPQNRSAMPDAQHHNWIKPKAIADVIYFHCTPQGSVIREPVIKVYHNS